MKRKLYLLLMLLISLTGMAADDMNQYVPSSYGGWQNLSASVNDLTCFTSDPLPMQAAVSGKTVHVFWTDWKPNAKGESCIYYRRSTDAGKTWEAARAIFASKNISTTDINYVGGSFGSNAKWFNVEGQNVQIVNVVKSDDGNNSELLFTYSTDGGKTFQQRVLAKGSAGDGHYYYGRPHIESDGQTVVIAFQHSRYNSTSYKTRVLTSFDGGATFKDKEIDKVQDLVDLKVSGKRWTVLGNDMYWYYNMWWGNVYLSTSTDGGETISTQNIAPLVKDDTSWCQLEYMKGANGASYNYHPQMTLEGDVINVIFQGCAEEVEGKSPTNDRNHTIFRRSTDGGKTWTKAMYVPETNGSEGAIAAKGNHIYVLQTPNGPVIHHSHDGGKTWEVQRRCYWDGRYDGYSNFYELYIAPDDASGQHVYMTGCRALLVESKDGFRTVNRTFSIGKESYYGGRSNNHSLTVLLDSEGTEHWFMNYQAPYKNFDPYFWNIVHRRNDPAPATTGKEMALDISKKVYAELTGTIVNDVTIPMTPSIMETRDATTVECWVRVDESDYSFEIASVTNSSTYHAGSNYQGGWYINANVKSGAYSFYAGLSTELSVDGKGKEVGSFWRYQIKDKGYWHHLALTYDSKQEKNNLRFYIDGALITSATEKGKIVMGNNPIVIGRTSTYGDKQKTLVDNFAIWSRALTQEEIQAHLYSTPDVKDKDCRLLLTFDGSLQDKSQYHNDPAPLMDAVLTGHDGIRPPHPDFTMTKEMNGQKVYVNDVTQDGTGVWWILPYPGNPNDYKSSEQRHVEQNFSGYPGTYTYTMAARGTGKCNAYATVSKTFTIGGLSRVYPTVVGQSEGVALHILGGYKLTYRNQPRVVLHGAGGDIEGKWLVDRDYDASKVASIDDLAPADFDLSKASAGKYDVIVGTDTLYQALTVEKSETPDVWVQVNGRDKMLWNNYQKYTITYGNRSNAPAYNVPFILCVPSMKGNVDVSFDFDISAISSYLDDSGQELAKQATDYMMAYDKQTGDSIICYMLLIPYVAPNSTGERSFRVRFKKPSGSNADELNMYYMIQDPWGIDLSDQANSRAQRRLYTMEQMECMALSFGQQLLEDGVVGQIPVAGCIYNAGKTVIMATIDIYNRNSGGWVNFGKNFGSAALSCGADLSGVGAVGKCMFIIGSMCWSAMNTYWNREDCLKGPGNKKKSRGVGSYDPNEMIGPAGYDDKAHYIKPIHNMAYTITYENKSTATAPAHEVFINDKLDASKYDLSTFSFTSFGWAGQQWSVGGTNTKEFTRNILYTVKGTEIMVRVSGALNEKTGEVNWSMISLKKNGDEIDDPDLGYLLPNKENGEGEGFVSFNVEHKPNPANGSTISNKATIVFDANDPIETNTYVNTFDTDYPTSKVTKVTEKNGQLAITIQGSDATSGIDSYSIYAKKNGGDWEALITRVTGSQVSVDCDPGTKYSLCALATDNVGWYEAKDLKAEAEITTSGDAPAGATYTLKVADAGYATFYDSKDNYKLPAELKAKVVSGNTGSSLSYQTISGNIVPKGTAVLIEATQKKAATYTLTSTTEAGSSVGTNLLYGSDVATTTSASGDNLYYKLSYGPSGTVIADSFGWFWGAQNGAAFRIEAHRAWLAVPKSSATRGYLIDGSATGITDLMREEQDSQPLLDLQGRRVTNPSQRGIYIQGNRKIIIK